MKYRILRDDEVIKRGDEFDGWGPAGFTIGLTVAEAKEKCNHISKYRREIEMNYMMIDGKKIELSDESVKNFKEGLKEEVELNFPLVMFDGNTPKTLCHITKKNGAYFTGRSLKIGNHAERWINMKPFTGTIEFKDGKVVE